jgi:hypothetical protein
MPIIYPDLRLDYKVATHPLEQQLDAVKGAGFDGFTAQLRPQHALEAQKRGLLVVGYFSSGDEDQFADLLKSQKDAGACHVNVQLADHDTDPDDALHLTLRLMEEAERIGDLEPAIEVHRDTCTETPEKTYALADGYFKATGELLPMTWDFSHLAVVKHLTPEVYVERLLVRPELIQRSQQFHFRPFNGHSLSTSGDSRRWKLDARDQRLVAFCERHDADLAGGERRN